MIFVIDNNILSRTFKNMPFKAFGDIIYAPLSDMINSGEILSVDEVYRELNRRWNDKSPEGKWLKAHKSCFQNITNEEGFVVAEIFKNKKFQEGVKKDIFNLTGNEYGRS